MAAGTKTTKIPTISDEDIECARRETVQRDLTRPRATAISYDVEQNRLVIDLVNGCTLLLPPHLLQGLENATAEQLRKVELYANGGHLHWPELDAQFSVESLSQGIFGTRSWMRELGAAMGSVGGRARSATKAASSRANGAKGGRPRKAAATGKVHA